jgi:hypothetical protein
MAKEDLPSDATACQNLPDGKMAKMQGVGEGFGEGLGFGRSVSQSDNNIGSPSAQKEKTPEGLDTKIESVEPTILDTRKQPTDGDLKTLRIKATNLVLEYPRRCQPHQQSDWTAIFENNIIKLAMEFSPVCIDRGSLEFSMGVVARILFDYKSKFSVSMQKSV